MKTVTKTSIEGPFLRSYFILTAIALGFFALPPMAQAQLPSPAPDGGYPGDNTAEGTNALFNLTSGTSNTAIGFNALLSDTTGVRNTAIGSGALQSNTEATDNTAVGYQALVNHIGGAETDFANGNTAVGSQALYSDQNGFDNTAVGWQALFFNNNTDPGDPLANRNTAIGYQALYSNVFGGHNTATGAFALYLNTGADSNTAIGYSALSNNTGSFNTAIGNCALCNNTTGSTNIALGDGAGDNLSTGDNNIDIGNEGVAGDANTIRIGTQGTQTRTFIAGIHGTVLGSGVAVRVNANGRLGTIPSSARFKQNIKPMDQASEAIFALKPVTFRYKQELDPEGTRQFGLVAEEVEQVNPDLVTRDKEGKPYSVRYDQVNSMLLNEFLKEHRKVDQLTCTVAKQDATIAQEQKDFRAAIARQRNGIRELTASLREQAAQIQKVSAQIEVNKFRSRTVLNSRDEP